VFICVYTGILILESQYKHKKIRYSLYVDWKVPSGKCLQKLWKDPPFGHHKIHYFYDHFQQTVSHYQRVRSRDPPCCLTRQRSSCKFLTGSIYGRHVRCLKNHCVMGQIAGISSAMALNLVAKCEHNSCVWVFSEPKKHCRENGLQIREPVLVPIKDWLYQLIRRH
jgi:hypothetical protein